MRVPRSIFRQYDIRGLVGERTDRATSPTPSAGPSPPSGGSASAGTPVLAVGRDNRPSGVALAAALRAGHGGGRGHRGGRGRAADAGTLLRRARPGARRRRARSPAPTIRRSSTASRWCSPASRCTATTSSSSTSASRWSRRRRARGGSRRTAPCSRGTRTRSSARHQLARPVRVVVDCGNGVGSLIAVATLRALGAEVFPLFCESDGTFPNHHPDPTVPANLRRPAGGSPADRGRARHRLRRRRGPDRRGGRDRPRCSSATSCWCSSAATPSAASVPARRSSST